jgi:hypothetical protein
MTADKDIADYLASQGYGTVGTDIFYGIFPDAKDTSMDNIICVYQTGGQTPDAVEDVEYPGIQLIIRGSDPDTVKAKVNNIFKALHGLINTTINSVVYHRIDAQGSPTDGGMDEKERRIFTIGFIVMKDYS